MRSARIVLLAVALVAGLLIAYLVMGMVRTKPDTVVTEVIREEAKTQILVASAAIGTGERLTPDSVQWQDWPEGAIRPEYVTISAMPEAPTQLEGAVVRFEFFPGEPIRQEKLVSTDQGYLSAVLAKGMRGVSVPVSAESSAGGFVVPNDRVDVILTQSTATGDVSEAILSNIRVLAIGTRLGEVGAPAGEGETAPEGGPRAQVFEDDTIATLELTPAQSETLINAGSRGRLSLALRSIADFRDNTVARNNASHSVRLIRFGQEQAVTAGTSAQMAAQAALASPVGEPAAPPEPQVSALPPVSAAPEVVAQ